MNARRALARAMLSVLMLAACGDADSSAGRCGNRPTVHPGVAPTPRIASLPQGTAGTVVVIGAWSDCFLPETVTVSAGQVVQWQAQEDGIAPEIVLEDGSSVGRVQHVLEVRFSSPGTYGYHDRSFPASRGTIVVMR